MKTVRVSLFIEHNGKTYEVIYVRPDLAQKHCLATRPLGTDRKWAVYLEGDELWQLGFTDNAPNQSNAAEWLKDWIKSQGGRA